jgi:ubiquinone/menaquinone biosynthesis C-methylase UbiE
MRRIRGAGEGSARINREMPEQDKSRGIHAAVEEHFGKLAESYGGGEYYTSRRAAVLSAIAPEIAAARRILDLGCGNGRYLEEFSRSAPAAFAAGADLSADMLAQARIRNGADAPLIRADACALPLRAALFDLIFASHVFPFVPDLRAAVRESVRCLAPGGALIASAGGNGMGQRVRSLVGAQLWARFRPGAFASNARGRVAGENEDLHREAFAAAGLAIETRSANFSIGWDGIEEWVRLRWLPFASEPERREAGEIFAEMKAAAPGQSFALEERILIGRKPAR